MSTTIVWFRNDLRLDDHPALFEATRTDRSIIPVFIWSPEDEGDWPPGAATKWWLHRSLKALNKSFEDRGGRLMLRKGSASKALLKLAQETGADTIMWNRAYEPAALKRDQEVRKAAAEHGLQTYEGAASLLFAPSEVATKQGTPYQVFTPFWKACLERIDDLQVLNKPRRWNFPASWPSTDKLSSLGLEPKISWDEGLAATWTPGEAQAVDNLRHFIDQPIERYDELRDRPDLDNTSRLSSHLHFGEISPRRIWQAVMEDSNAKTAAGLVKNSEAFLRQIVWREFSHHLIYHFPQTPSEPLREQFEDFPWRKNKARLEAWTKGETGYPIVDAGMRQLWKTGWMHNRVRMICASFLVKHLLLPWQDGARWFWDTLVDADLANNTMGWQWTAGCGADAAPYFRIFNPMLQSKKFDKKGRYIKKYIPELENCPEDSIHEPWEGLFKSKDYPDPIVNHKEARQKALDAYQDMRS